MVGQNEDNNSYLFRRQPSPIHTEGSTLQLNGQRQGGKAMAPKACQQQTEALEGISHGICGKAVAPRACHKEGALPQRGAHPSARQRARGRVITFTGSLGLATARLQQHEAQE